MEFSEKVKFPSLVDELHTIEEQCWGRMLCELAESNTLVGLRVAIGRDSESAACFQFNNMFSGTTATAPTATTFTTDGINIPLNTVVGQYILCGGRFGIIQSNTSAGSSVLTIDRWYNPAAALPANAGTAAASTPAAGVWYIPSGNVPFGYMALTANAGAAADGTTSLTGEITTVGGGLIRQLATYAHTAAGATSTMTQTFTANGTDALPVTVAKIGIFQGVVQAASRIFFETLINATATLTTSGDQVQITETVTL